MVDSNNVHDVEKKQSDQPDQSSASSQTVQKKVQKQQTVNQQNIIFTKIGIILLLTLILMIPAVLIYYKLGDRQKTRNDVVREIGQKWSLSQVVAGPYIKLPYMVWDSSNAANYNHKIRYFYILPYSLQIDGDVKTQKRYRGIYSASLYQTQLKLTGGFVFPDANKYGVRPEDILWDQAQIAVDVSDIRGVGKVEVNLDGQKLVFNPDQNDRPLYSNHSLSSNFLLARHLRKMPFTINLNLRGSKELGFLPLGEQTKVTLTSNWDEPSFVGSFLPENHEISDSNFTANWHVSSLNRNYPQISQSKMNWKDLKKSAFGVNFFNHVDNYQKNERVFKYSILVILFTFIAFFLAEILSATQVHPIQYLLVGLAVILFYLLNLAISEHLRFDTSYAISAVAVILTISGYVRAIFRSTKHAATIFGFLVILYSFLYIILQLKDYALLMGSIALFIVLVATMFLTRKIDWYNLGANSAKK